MRVGWAEEKGEPLRPRIRLRSEREPRLPGARLGRAWGLTVRGGFFIFPVLFAGVAQLVEHFLAKEDVASSSLVTRSPLHFQRLTGKGGPKMA